MSEPPRTSLLPRESLYTEPHKTLQLEGLTPAGLTPSKRNFRDLEKIVIKPALQDRSD